MRIGAGIVDMRPDLKVFVCMINIFGALVSIFRSDLRESVERIAAIVI